MQSELADNRECVDDSLATSAYYYITKDRCVDDSCATPTVETLCTRTVCCSLLGHYSTYVPSAEEAATRYRAKALVTDNTLLEGLLIVLVFAAANHALLIIHLSVPIAILGQMFYRYGENVLVRIIAYNR